MKYKFCLIVVLLFNAIHLYADSPLTSTEFYKAYYEIPIITKAKADGILNYETASFLSSRNVTIDKKIALINALGWENKERKNKVLYEIFLRNKYKFDSIDYSIITSDEHLCLGYLLALDDYFNVQDALFIINNALKRNSKSYTYNIVYGLVLSQLFLDQSFRPDYEFNLINKNFISFGVPNWCNVYFICCNIESNNLLNQDFRKSAKREIFAYINIYKDYCNSETLVLLPSVYPISKLIGTSIKLTRVNGIYTIPVKVNGNPEINFIFDSGASDVQIPNYLYLTLKKQKLISKNDILGWETYKIANGTIVKQLSIILRKVQIGDIIVTDVKASVGSNNVPLLLGQSFLTKFKKFSIDNEKGFLEIDPVTSYD